MVSHSYSEQQAAVMRALAQRLGLPPIKQAVLAPGVSAVLRLTIYYHNQRAVDSIATLCHSRIDGTSLAVTYRGAFKHQPIRHQIPAERFETLAQGLASLRFDRLRDQPGMPPYGLDFWMLERAAASFSHSVILAPGTAEDAYAELVALLREHLPEALRIIPEN